MAEPTPDQRSAGQPTRWLEGAGWIGVAAILTALLVDARDRVTDAHVAITYLLVVLGASARCGRRVGFILAAACFLAFNFFFVAPFGTFAVRNPLDWLVLIAFLLTSVSAAQLLHRARAEAAAAAAAERVERLRDADRIKDAMLSAVSHDLRTPLTSIKALAHSIAVEGDERAVEIESEADRLNRYVTKLLDLSRINAGAVPVKPELVPVDDLLSVLLQQMDAIANGRELRVEMPPDWTRVVGWFDYALTLRILANLVENALQYSDAATAVELRVARVAEVIRFEVADRGAGIAPEESERIFQPFERGTSGRETGGTGLGLAIARQLAEAQGGTLSAAQRAGGGTVFVLLLPAASDATLAAGSP